MPINLSLPRHPRTRASDVDKHVGARLRERRVLLGLTQEQVAGRLGVTGNQTHKYEHGINRISAGKLFELAQALGVEVDYFFEGLEEGPASGPTPSQRMLLDLAQNVAELPREHQQAILAVTRVFANNNGGEG